VPDDLGNFRLSCGNNYFFAVQTEGPYKGYFFCRGKIADATLFKVEGDNLLHTEQLRADLLHDSSIRVCIKNKRHGLYVWANQFTYRRLKSSEHCKTEESFLVEMHTDGHLSLKSYMNHSLSFGVAREANTATLVLPNYDLLCPEVLDDKVLLKTIHGMYLAVSADGKVEAGPRKLSTDAELTFENANEGSVEKIKAFTNSVKKENKHCFS